MPSSSPPVGGRKASAGGFFLSQADIDRLDARDFPVLGPDHDALTSDAEARYRALIRHLPDTIVALYDRDLIGVSIDGPRVAEANYPAEAFEGKPLGSVMPAADYEDLLPLYQAALTGE